MIQAEWLGAEGEVGTIWPDSVWSRGTSTTERRPRQGLSGMLFFFAGGVLECDLANRRSVTVLCMLFMIKRDPMHHLGRVLPFPYVPSSVIRGALVAHWHSFVPSRCRTSQCRRTFVHLSVSL